MKKCLFPILLFSLLISCGKDDGGSDQGEPPAPERSVQEQVSEGSYRAILRPLNNSLSGYIPTGFAEIKIIEDQVEVKTLLDDDARVSHMQSIHTGTQCPTLATDLNKDGLIDVEEANKMAGPVMIPLDSDINSKEAGAGIYPVGRGFTYIEKASLQNLEDDVRSRIGQNLNLAGRVILIHGVDALTKVPATMKGVPGMSRQASAPVACGIIYRIEQVPQFLDSF